MRQLDLPVDKMCLDCLRYKPLREFCRNKRKRDGINTRCKTCMAIRKADFDTRNPEWKVQYNVRYRASHPGLWHKYKTPELNERQRIKMRDVRRKNPDHWKDYYRRNYHKFLNAVHIRRSRLGGPGITEQEWQEIQESFGHACAYCLISQDKLTMDHFTPISRGGRHEYGNIVPACGSCNKSKNAALVFAWVPRMI